MSTETSCSTIISLKRTTLLPGSLFFPPSGSERKSSRSRDVVFFFFCTEPVFFCRSVPPRLLRLIHEFFEVFVPIHRLGVVTVPHLPHFIQDIVRLSNFLVPRVHVLADIMIKTQRLVPVTFASASYTFCCVSCSRLLLYKVL